MNIDIMYIHTNSGPEDTFRILQNLNSWILLIMIFLYLLQNAYLEMCNKYNTIILCIFKWYYKITCYTT